MDSEITANTWTKALKKSAIYVLHPTFGLKAAVLAMQLFVDNVFLPQDRVCEFDKLTPVDLLRETEKAIGDPQLPFQHDALIQRSEELERLQNAMDRIRESLNREKGLNAGIERDVE